MNHVRLKFLIATFSLFLSSAWPEVSFEDGITDPKAFLDEEVMFQCCMSLTPAEAPHGVELSEVLPSATFSSDPTSYTSHSVNVISGTFADGAIDASVGGVEPIIWRRSMEGQTPFRQDAYAFGSIGSEFYLFSDKPKGESRVDALYTITDRNGNSIPYSIQSGGRCGMPKEFLKGCFSNTALGMISGRTHPNNVKMQTLGNFFLGKDALGFVLADGTERSYAKLRTLSPNKQGLTRQFMTLVSEKRPTGHLLHVDSDEEGRFKKARVVGPSGKCYGWLEVTERDPQTPDFTLKTSTGQHYRYTYEKVGRHRRDRYVLQSITGSDRPPLEYSYLVGRKEFCAIKKRSVAGNVLENQYYTDGVHLVMGKKVKIDGKSPEVHRIKAQRAPVGSGGELVTTHEFLYDRISPSGGMTTVRDLFGQKTIYRYLQQRLSRVNFLDREENSLGSVAMEWADKEEECGRLLQKTWYGPNKEPLLRKAFLYDTSGNILEERTSGRFTGKQFAEAPKGLNRQESGFEETVKRLFSYRQDGSNLPESLTDAHGVTTRFLYHKKTPLLAAKLVTYQGKIFQRFFFDYDVDGVLLYTIEDDGSQEERTNLSDVTERRITEIRPVVDGTAIGKPKEVLERYWDGKQEVLLKRTLSSYDKQGRCIEQQIFDANNQLAYRLQWIYDTKDHLVKEIDASGNVLEYIYDECGNQIMIRGPLPGFYKEQSFDACNRLVAVHEFHPDGSFDTMFNSWNALSQKIAVQDGFGNQTTYLYDAMGRVIETVTPELYTPEQGRFRPSLKRGYDFLGRLTSETDANGYSEKKQLNAAGMPLKLIHPDGSVEQMEYALNGDLLKKTNANGSYTLYACDPFGRVTKESLYTRSGNALHTVQHRYNAFREIATIDAEGRETLYTFDGAGRRIVTLVGKQKTEYFYDAMGRENIERKWFGKGPSDYVETVKLFNVQDKVIEESMRDGSGQTIKKSSYTYDALGNCTELMLWIDQESRAITRTRYDSRSREVEVIDAEGNSTRTFYEHKINSLGQKVLQKTRVASDGTLTIICHDVHENVASIVKKNGMGQLLAQIEYFWDGCKHKVAQIDHLIFQGKKSHTVSHSWSYGPGGRLEEQIQAVGSSEEKHTKQIYDKLGRLQKKVLPNGTHLNHIYNEEGRLSRLWSENTPEKAIDYRYSYDVSGHCIEERDAIKGHRIIRAYAKDGTLASEAFEGHWKESYTHDPIGRRLSLSLNEAHLITYGYQNGFLKKVAASANKMPFTYLYKERNLQGRATVTEGCGLTMQHPIDLLGRPLGLRSLLWSQLIERGDYNSSGMLRKTTILDGEGEETTCYKYDDMRHLVEEKGAHNHTFTFDSQHNRRSCDQHVEKSNLCNQLTEDHEARYIYDRNGNLTAREGKNPLFYTYDALDRLIAIEAPSNWRVEMEYDAEHRRLSKRCYKHKEGKWIAAETRYFIWDGENEVGSVNEKGELLEWRILGEGMGAEMGASLALWLNDHWYMPLHDHRGSITALVGTATKTVVESYAYSAFGIEETPLDPLSPWRFSSKRVEEESGLIYFGRRFYNPTTARWLTCDPAGFVDGANLYAYVLGNPVNYVDPKGLSSKGLWTTLGIVANVAMAVCSGGLTTHAALWSMLCQAVETTAFHTGLLPIAALARVARMDFSSPDFIRHVSQNIVVGSLQNIAKCCVAMTNGINVSFPDAQEQASLLSDCIDGGPVMLAYNSTQGICLDLLECFANKLSLPMENVQKQVECWRECLAKSEYIIQVSHSQGAIITKAALNCMTAEERKRMIVITLGGGSMIQKGDLLSCLNIVSVKDPVPFICDLPGIIDGCSSTSRTPIMFINWEHAGTLFLDHCFAEGSVYHHAIAFELNHLKSSGVLKLN